MVTVAFILAVGLFLLLERNAQETKWSSADSGIRSESEEGVRLALLRPLPSCRVRYKPETPGESIADCR